MTLEQLAKALEATKFPETIWVAKGVSLRNVLDIINKETVT